MKIKKLAGCLVLAAATAAMCFSLAACGDSETGDAGTSGGSSSGSATVPGTKEYVFEAEYTDLSNWYGAGYSNNPTGVMAICEDIYNASASNGYFICDMYSNGSTIFFDIEATGDVDNVTLVLRATSEHSISTITSSEFLIAYYAGTGDDGSTIIEYDTMEFTGVNSAWKNSGLRAFSDFTIATDVSLKEGMNHIVMQVNNTTRVDGTATAKAPLVDCIKLYVSDESDVTLSMTPNEASLKQIQKLEDQ